jgi:acetyltransferase-like isoleucine patch superfamily enzyme
MSRTATLLAQEGAVHGLRLLALRSARKAARTANAAALGWRDGRLPLGSTVIGARRISVGAGFDAAQPVWLEAVSEYAGVQHDPHIRIGDRFTTSGRLHISAVDGVRIGDDCLFGTNVYVGDHSHGFLDGADPSSPDTAPRERPLAARGAVRIGDRVWLGDNVVVVSGVTIGDGAVIGANSVVTRDVPSGAVAAGSPARVIKQWDPEARSWVSTRRAEVDV